VAADLTPKQSAFVREYLVDLNATKAAIRAGYSEDTAYSIGSENLTKPEIAEAIQDAMKQRASRVELKSDDILRELLRMATVDISLAFDESGDLKPLHEIPEDVRRCIAGVEVQERTIGEDEDAHVVRVKKVKFWDKPRALELLGKHLKLFVERHEHTGKDGGPIQTEELSPLEAARTILFALEEVSRSQTQH